MKRKNVIILPLLILTVCFINLQSLAQTSKAEVIGAYVYNFAKLSDAKKQSKLSTYNITIVSDNNDLISEFRNMAKDVKIKDKEIVLTHSPNAENINLENTCLIFIGADKLHHYNQIFESTKLSEIMLVSENYSEKRKILLNLYETNDGKLLFEINKGNIYERKLEISEEILLMGGTEIDIVELYLNSQQKLNKSDSLLGQLNANLDSIKNELNITQEQVNDHVIEIEQQKNLIYLQKKERNNLTHEIESYKNTLVNQKSDLNKSQQKLIVFNDSLKNSETKLQNFKAEIAKSKETLNEQLQQILNKEEVLAQKNIIIKRQQNIVILVISGLLIMLVLSVLLLINYRDKKRKNKQLITQKREISEQNDKLEHSKEIILSINQKLNERNDELKNSLEEIKKIQNQLVQSEKMASLGVLSAGIAHEINNPINFVYAGINSLLRDFNDIEPIINEVSKLDLENDNLKEKIKIIQKLKEENYFDEAIEAIPHIISDIKLGADRTAEIVKGLRSFSRMDNEIAEPLNVNEGLETSLLLLKNKYKTHIEIVKNYSSDLPVLKCFPGKINQAFLNLISNAIDAIEGKGTIWLTTSHSNNKIIVSVKDTGIGISKELQAKLFDPFFTTKAVGEGTGLGLSITYGIIKDHKGSIKVISEPNKGSEFIITLPIP